MKAIVKDKTSCVDYVFPFEGEKHLATLIILPYRDDTWREKAKPAMAEYLNLVKAIAPIERVIVIIDPRIPYQTVNDFQIENVTVYRLFCDDSWARDTLPVFLQNPKDSELLGVDFGFNSWGGDFDGLYKPWDNDNTLGRKVLLEMRMPRYPYKDFILEGGSIHTDGEGTILTTDECLLSKGRNPSLTKDQIENNLLKSLNAKKVLFLPFGIYEDETDGHVDNIACFSKPGTVLLAWTDDEKDPQYERSKADYDFLINQTDAQGRKLEVIKVLLPEVQYLTKEEAEGINADKNAIQRKPGRRLAASYINFYQSADFVIVPQFGVKEDQIAVNQFKEIYPAKKIIPLYSREILLGGGNIHCITKQVPFSKLYPIEPEDIEK